MLRLPKLLIGFIILLLVNSCTASQPSAQAISTPGFWLGLWQGFIAPITFFISLFPNDVRIYAFPNAGLWYDLGFMLGISGFSGGIFASSRNKKRED